MVDTGGITHSARDKRVLDGQAWQYNAPIDPGISTDIKHRRIRISMDRKSRMAKGNCD